MKYLYGYKKDLVETIPQKEGEDKQKKEEGEDRIAKLHWNMWLQSLSDCMLVAFVFLPYKIGLLLISLYLTLNIQINASLISIVF